MKQDMALISSAMISSIWESDRKDTIDLATPFVKYIIYSNYDENQELNMSYITKSLKEKFEFRNFPIVILDKILSRLCKQKNQIIKKKNGKYILLNKEDGFISVFENKKINIENKNKLLCEEFSKFIDDNSLRLNRSNESIENYIYSYFYKHGYTILINKRTNVAPNNDYASFWIEQFSLYLHNTGNELFDYFNDIAMGFMISKAIYIEECSTNNLKNLNIYIDPPLMLSILELKSAEENNSAKELLELLLENNVKVNIFEHSVEELKGIIRDYIDKRYTHSTRRIEYFDQIKASDPFVNSYIKNIENKIKEKGVKILDTPSTSEINIDEDAIFNSLKDKYTNFAKNISIENDKKSLVSIIRLRNNKQLFSSIDDCKHLLISKNTVLVMQGKFLLGNNPKNMIGLAMSDTDLITLLWIRNKKSIRDISKLKVIEYSNLSIETTKMLKDNFYNSLNNLSENGKISEEDINALIESVYDEKELLFFSRGNPKNINNATLLSRLNYVSSNKMNNEVDKRMFLPFESPNVRKVNVIAEKLKRKIKFVAKSILIVLFIIVTISLLKNVYNSYKNSSFENINIVNFIFQIIYEALSIFLFVIDFFNPTKSIVDKGINFIINKLKIWVLNYFVKIDIGVIDK